MGQIKGLIDEFSKLTGEIQVENTFDINFWNVQISEFANIVMKTIREMDHLFHLNSQLEYTFGIEFQKQWKKYKDVQDRILKGEIPVDYNLKERSINQFNVVPTYNDLKIFTPPKGSNTNSAFNINDDIINDESFNEDQINFVDDLDEKVNVIDETTMMNNNNNDVNEKADIIDDEGTLTPTKKTHYSSYLSGEEDFKENDDFSKVPSQYTEREYNDYIIDQQIANDPYFDETSTEESSGEIISTDDYKTNVKEMNTIQTDMKKKLEKSNEKLTRIAIVKQLLNNKYKIDNGEITDEEVINSIITRRTDEKDSNDEKDPSEKDSSKKDFSRKDSIEKDLKEKSTEEKKERKPIVEKKILTKNELQTKLKRKK